MNLRAVQLDFWDLEQLQEILQNCMEEKLDKGKKIINLWTFFQKHIIILRTRPK